MFWSLLVYCCIGYAFALDKPTVKTAEDSKTGLHLTAKAPAGVTDPVYYFKTKDKDGQLIKEEHNKDGKLTLTDCHIQSVSVSYVDGKETSDIEEVSLKGKILAKKPPAPKLSKTTPQRDAIEVELVFPEWFDQLDYYYTVDTKPTEQLKFEKGKARITDCAAKKLDIFSTNLCQVVSEPFTIDLEKLMPAPDPPSLEPHKAQSTGMLFKWKEPSKGAKLITQYKYELSNNKSELIKHGQVISSVHQVELTACHGVKFGLYSMTHCKTSVTSSVVILKSNEYPAPLKPKLTVKREGSLIKAEWAANNSGMPVDKYIVDVKPEDSKIKPIHKETNDTHGEFEVTSKATVTVKAVGQCGKESEAATQKVNNSTRYLVSFTLITAIAFIVSAFGSTH